MKKRRAVTNLRLAALALSWWWGAAAAEEIRVAVVCASYQDHYYARHNTVAVGTYKIGPGGQEEVKVDTMNKVEWNVVDAAKILAGAGPRVWARTYRDGNDCDRTTEGLRRAQISVVMPSVRVTPGVSTGHVTVTLPDDYIVSAWAVSVNSADYSDRMAKYKKE